MTVVVAGTETIPTGEVALGNSTRLQQQHQPMYANGVVAKTRCIEVDAETGFDVTGGVATHLQVQGDVLRRIVQRGANQHMSRLVRGGGTQVPRVIHDGIVLAQLFRQLRRERRKTGMSIICSVAIIADYYC